ncbi:MAG: 4Fe-4S binding protein [Candidatus Asgardarchaeia archaeon]
MARAYRVAITDSELCVGCQSCMFACSRRLGDGGLGKSAILVKSKGGVENGFTIVVCKACKDPPCAKVCPTDALILRKEGGVLLDTKKCIGCGLCVDACVVGAVFWDEENRRPRICVYCGYCTNFCPYGVLKMEPLEVEEK